MADRGTRCQVERRLASGMAHSIQVLHGRHEIFNDWDLFVIVSLGGELVKASPNQYSAIASPVSRWQNEAPGYGPGCIDLGLEQLDPVGARGLIKLLDAIDERAATYGDRIPATTLQPICRFHGVRFNDYPVSSLRDATEKLRRLLSSL